MNQLPHSQKPRAIALLLWRLVRRFRWWIAGPVLRPILAEAQEYAANLRRSAKMGNTPREWAYACNEKADTLDAQVIQIEQAFGCTSFNEKHHYVRHYK